MTPAGSRAVFLPNKGIGNDLGRPLLVVFNGLDQHPKRKLPDPAPGTTSLLLHPRFPKALSHTEALLDAQCSWKPRRTAGLQPT